VPAVEATLVAPPAGALTTDGPSTWQAPTRSRIRIVAAIRDDVPAKMFARHQIDRACFMAARDYENLYGTAAAVHLRSVDASMPPISGRRGDGFEAGVDAQRRAVKVLAQVEARLMRRYGDEGLQLLRDVLGRGCTIEVAARERGEATKDRIGWWGSFFRRCLKVLAVLLGHATKDAYRVRHHHQPA
jgi:hypothetical protein